MHGGPRVGLGQHQQRLLARLGLHRVGQPAEGLRHLLVGPQDAQPGAGDRTEVVVAVALLQLVLAVAEEREVLVGQPLEQVARLPDLLGIQRRRVVAQALDDLGDPGVHLLPVLDGLADVAQHPLDVVDDLGRVVVVAEPVDLDVHPRLADGVVDGLAGAVGHGQDLLQLAGDVAVHVEAGVDDQVHVALLARELHREGVDQERHVVDDDLHDRVTPGRPAVLAQRRGEHAHLRGPLRSVAGQLVLRRQRPEDVDVAAVDEVLRRDVTVVGPQQRAHVAVRWPAGPLAVPGHLGGLVEELGLVTFLRRR